MKSGVQRSGGTLAARQEGVVVALGQRQRPRRTRVERPQLREADKDKLGVARGGEAAGAERRPRERIALRGRVALETPQRVAARPLVEGEHADRTQVGERRLGEVGAAELDGFAVREVATSSFHARYAKDWPQKARRSSMVGALGAGLAILSSLCVGIIG